jgi:hypothetical protein
MNTGSFSDPYQAELAKALHFTPGDLAANRQGTLTLRQIRRLQMSQRRFYWTILTLLSLWIAFWSTLALTTSLLRTDMGALGWIVLLGTFIGLAIWIAYRQQDAFRTIADAQEAVLSETFRPGSGWLQYRQSVLGIQVGGRCFAVERALYRKLHPDQDYRIYYAPHLYRFTAPSRCREGLSPTCASHRILSIEPIESVVDRPAPVPVWGALLDCVHHFATLQNFDKPVIIFLPDKEKRPEKPKRDQQE